MRKNQAQVWTPTAHIPNPTAPLVASAQEIRAFLVSAESHRFTKSSISGAVFPRRGWWKKVNESTTQVPFLRKVSTFNIFSYRKMMENDGSYIFLVSPSPFSLEKWSKNPSRLLTRWKGVQVPEHSNCRYFQMENSYPWRSLRESQNPLSKSVGVMFLWLNNIYNFYRSPQKTPPM